MKIAAIGGGDKAPILQPILDGLESPDVIIIPSACSTEKSYNKKVAACKAFFVSKNLYPKVLHNFEEIPPASKVEDLIGAASLAYVIGGNTPHLIKTTARHGSDSKIKTATLEERLWLTGTSAGALWPFTYGQSCPVARPAEVEWEFTYLRGLGLINAAFGAHADKIDPHATDTSRKNRLSYMVEALPQETSVGFAAENNAALIINGSSAWVGRATPDANVYAIEQQQNHNQSRAIDNDALTDILGRIGCFA